MGLQAVAAPAPCVDDKVQLQQQVNNHKKIYINDNDNDNDDNNETENKNKNKKENINNKITT